MTILTGKYVGNFLDTPELKEYVEMQNGEGDVLMAMTISSDVRVITALKGNLKFKIFHGVCSANGKPGTFKFVLKDENTFEGYFEFEDVKREYVIKRQK